MSHANKWLNAGEQKHEDHTVWSTSSIDTVKAYFTTAASLVVARSSNLQFAPAAALSKCSEICRV